MSAPIDPPTTWISLHSFSFENKQYFFVLILCLHTQLNPSKPESCIKGTQYLASILERWGSISSFIVWTCRIKIEHISNHIANKEEPSTQAKLDLAKGKIANRSPWILFRTLSLWFMQDHCVPLMFTLVKTRKMAPVVIYFCSIFLYSKSHYFLIQHTGHWVDMILWPIYFPSLQTMPDFLHFF